MSVKQLQTHNIQDTCIYEDHSENKNLQGYTSSQRKRATVQQTFTKPINISRTNKTTVRQNTVSTARKAT